MLLLLCMSFVVSMNKHQQHYYTLLSVVRKVPKIEGESLEIHRYASYRRRPVKESEMVSAVFYRKQLPAETGFSGANMLRRASRIYASLGSYVLEFATWPPIAKRVCCIGFLAVFYIKFNPR